MSTKISTTLVIALYILVTGCTKSIHFRVIDAATGEPLSGVRVLRKGYNASFFSGPVNEAEQLGPTDADGIVVAQGLRSASAPYFFFSKDGYEMARAITGGDKWETLSVSSPWIPKLAEKRVEQPRLGVVTISLHRKQGDR